MALGNGIRRNLATISEEEKTRLRDAIVQPDGSKFYPDSISNWDKQDEIHQAPAFMGAPRSCRGTGSFATGSKLW